MHTQLPLLDLDKIPQKKVEPFKSQLLKWIGNKQRFAHEIIRYFPPEFGTYFEPFLGSGAILGTLAPLCGVGSDALGPLIEIWKVLKTTPDLLKEWYSSRWHKILSKGKVEAYEEIKLSYNLSPNGADLLFLSRSCYGGVVRFRRDGYISTPCGIHSPITPEKFSERVDLWHNRVVNCEFVHSDFEEIMRQSKKGDLIYCDPPYSDTQTILYGAQSFSLTRLLHAIVECKKKGVYVVLSIDGTKKTGRKRSHIKLPPGLFEREVVVDCGRSMLRRFQMEGQTLQNEVVSDRLLLTF